MSIDQRSKLEEEPFAYHVAKNNRVRIDFEGRYIMTLGEKASAQFLAKARDKDTFAVQLLLAKVTGNFKHGNEKNKKKY